MSQFKASESETELDDVVGKLSISASTTSHEAIPSVQSKVPLTVPTVYNAPGTTVVTSLEVLEHFGHLVEGKKTFALDAEGVNLSRLGSLTVLSLGVQVASGVHVFLFDMLTTVPSLSSAQVAVLKEILENSAIEKIIHDCRQDSDALNHQMQITLRKVFDTQVYGLNIERTSRRVNLNQTLKNYSCVANANRDLISDMYKRNPNFWSTRPLTPFMIEYASKDVVSLFDLRVKLLSEVLRRMPEKAIEIALASEAALSDFRGLPCHEIVPVPKSKIGCVIGRGGSGVTSIERRTGAMIACPFGDGFLVLGTSPSVLARARQEIRDSYY